MNKLHSFILWVLLTNNCYAAQIYHYRYSGQRINAQISAHDISCIMFSKDKIVDVHGNENDYEIKTDHFGHIYIKPKTESIDKLIPLFVTTEQGCTLQLMLSVLAIPASSIIIKKAERLEPTKNAINFENEVAAIMYRLQKSSMENYGRNKMGNHSKLRHTIKGLDYYTISRFDFNHLHGEVLSVINKGYKSIKLDEHDFYKPGVIAISIKNRFISRKQKTNVYRVLING